MEILFDVASWICLLIGSFFCMTGGIGLLRFPDFFTRIHAASLTDTMGASMVLIGLMLQFDGTIVFLKLAVILVFSLLAGASASHAMAKAALESGMKAEIAEQDASASEEAV